MRKPANVRKESEQLVERLRNAVALLKADLNKAQARIAELTRQLAQQGGASSKTNDAQQVTALLAPLSRRERQVAILFVETASDKLVAHRLGRAVQTVRNHIASILNKLGVGSRDQLLLLLLSVRPPTNGTARDGDMRSHCHR
jgi:DNA-binding NarL/FixJ family response regulator